MSIDATTTLGDLVTADPRRTRVLERFGLDYCCNGHRTLTEASAAAGLDLAEVADALDIADPAPAQQWQHLENADLAHDIVDTHHAYLWEEMPRLQALVDKVATVHGSRHRELAGVQAAYTTVIAHLDPHMTKEERRVFPAISKLEKAQGPVPLPFSLPDTIEELRSEHDAVGQLFTQIRELTDGYAVPEDACNSYRAMLTGLQEMEHDLHVHIHKENNILFPAVVELHDRVNAG